MKHSSAQITRLYTSLFLVMLLFLVLLGRGVYLVTDQRSFLLYENKKRVQRHEVIPAQRGMIIDRSGKPLAVSKKTYEISFDPSITKWRADEMGPVGMALSEMNNLIRATTEAYGQNDTSEETSEENADNVD